MNPATQIAQVEQFGVTVRTFWETMTSKPAGSRRLVREWVKAGHVVRFDVIAERVVYS